MSVKLVVPKSVEEHVATKKGKVTNNTGKSREGVATTKLPAKTIPVKAVKKIKNATTAISSKPKPDTTRAGSTYGGRVSK